MHKTYTTQRLPKLFLEAFPLCRLTRNQPTCEWLGRMMVLRTQIHTDLVSCAWMQDDMAAQLRCYLYYTLTTLLG